MSFNATGESASSCSSGRLSWPHHDGDTWTIAEVQQADSAATNQTVARSILYDRFTPALAALLSDLLKHALEEVAVPYTVLQQSKLFHEVVIADETVEWSAQL